MLQKCVIEIVENEYWANRAENLFYTRMIIVRLKARFLKDRVDYFLH